MLFLVVVILLTVLFYLKVIKPFHTWEEKGVPHVKPVYFFGNMAESTFKTKCFSDVLLDLYNTHPKERCVGVYQFLQPVLMLRDADLIKQMTIKNFDVFPEHRTFSSEETDPLWGKNLFQLNGQRWREMRPTLSPIFTSSKMRSMFILMNECAEQFTKYFLEQSKDMIELEMKDVFTRYTNDVIATTAFGLECDSLRQKNNEFYIMGKEATTLTTIRTLKFFMSSISPILMKAFKMTIFSEDVSKFFRGIIKETINVRETKGIIRPDLIHTLMEARKGKLQYEEKNSAEETGFAVVEESEYGKNTKRKLDLSDDDIVAQALIFFLAGFDTASTLMSFIAYELAVNTDIQKRLMEEVDEAYAQCNGNVTYETISKMKYMDMVVSETLRKWPPALFTDRRSVKPYTIEPVKPGERPIHLEKGSLIWLPILAIQRDPQYFPNPDKFDPERFSDENKSSINPSAYIPFGSGPRNCIGSRFAILENKTLFFHILRNFEIVPVKRTLIPMVLSKSQFNPTPENGNWLGFKPRKMAI